MTDPTDIAQIVEGGMSDSEIEQVETSQPAQAELDKAAQHKKIRNEWLGVTTFGWFVIWIVLFSWYGKLETFVYRSSLIEGLRQNALSLAVSFVAAGAFLGLLEWAVIRQYIRGVGWWIPVTAIGLTAGGFLSFFPISQLNGFCLCCGAGSLAALAGGAVVGLIQWPILIAADIPLAWRWVLSNIISGLPIIGGLETGNRLAILIEDRDEAAVEDSKITAPEAVAAISPESEITTRKPIPNWVLPIGLGSLALVTLAVVWSFYTIDTPNRVKRQADNWVEQGRSHAEQDMHNEAIDDYTRAIELNPQLGEAYYLRGKAYHEIDEPEKAIADFTCTIEINPEYSKAYRFRGVVYRNMGDYEVAIGDFNRAIEIDPKYDQAYISRGIAYGKLGDYEAALADFTHAIELDPNYANAYNNRAWHLALSNGDLDQAIEDANRAIQLESDADYYDTRGFVYYKLGEYEAALADYNQALELGLDYSYYGRGLVYETLGELEKALEDYNRFLDAYPDDELFSDDARARIEALEG